MTTPTPERLHVYCYGGFDWLVGASPADAEAAAHEQIGWTLDGEWDPLTQENDDAYMGIWMDEAGEISDGGIFVWGQMSTWAEAFGRGFLCSTEY